jgi:hypothetical protein
VYPSPPTVIVLLVNAVGRPFIVLNAPVNLLVNNCNAVVEFVTSLVIDLNVFWLLFIKYLTFIHCGMYNKRKKHYNF